MRKSRFREEQIVGILKRARRRRSASGALCRRHGISQQTLYRWKQQVRRLGRKGGQTAEGAGGGERPAQAPGRRAGAGQSGAQGTPPKKLVTPAQRRAAVGSRAERFGFSQRRACRLVGAGAVDRPLPVAAARDDDRAARSAPRAGGAPSALRLPPPARPAAPGRDRRQPQAGRAAVPAEGLAVRRRRRKVPVAHPARSPTRPASSPTSSGRWIS